MSSWIAYSSGSEIVQSSGPNTQQKQKLEGILSILSDLKYFKGFLSFEFEEIVLYVFNFLSLYQLVYLS